jgi:hypothetical protein
MQDILFYFDSNRMAAEYYENLYTVNARQNVQINENKSINDKPASIISKY